MPETKARKGTRSSGAGTKPSSKRDPGKRALMTRPGEISPAQRHRMIAERAYFNAAGRGFAGDRCLDDWLQAESDIERELHI